MQEDRAQTSEVWVWSFGNQTNLEKLFVGLARTIYIRCTYGIFGLEIIKYMVYKCVYIRFWPTLVIWLQVLKMVDLSRLSRSHWCCMWLHKVAADAPLLFSLILCQSPAAPPSSPALFIQTQGSIWCCRDLWGARDGSGELQRLMCLDGGHHATDVVHCYIGIVMQQLHAALN